MASSMGVTQNDVEPIDVRLLANVLSEIALVTSDTLQLPEVFERVAAPVRKGKAAGGRRS